MAIIKNPLTIVQQTQEEKNPENCFIYSDFKASGVVEMKDKTWKLVNSAGTQISALFGGENTWTLKLKCKAVGSYRSHSNEIQLFSHNGTSGTAATGVLMHITGGGTDYIDIRYVNSSSQEKTFSLNTAVGGEKITDHYGEWFEIFAEYDGEKITFSERFEDGTSATIEIQDVIKNYSAVVVQFFGYWKTNGNFFIDTQNSYFKNNGVMIWGDE